MCNKTAGKGEILIANANANNDAVEVSQNNTKQVTLAETANANAKVNGRRPWYVRGGFHVNGAGMAANVLVPPVLLLMTASKTSLHPSLTPVEIFAAAFFVQVAVALAEGMITFFCVAAVPIYLASLLVLPATLSTSVAPTLALAFSVALWRVGVCMSVCLHRYAAHAAFRCSPATRLFVNVLGCAANQGGPIWWASQHRLHHKHCDLPRDPHSSIIDGVERAFAFFSLGHGIVEEEFAPKHNDTWMLRLLDTFAFVVCSAELYVAHRYFGREGLFVSYTSMWICQTVTLWFNIANHPPDAQPGKACQAANFQGKPTCWYPAFRFLDAICPLYSGFSSEGAHGDHHLHFMLAKREKYDCAYYALVWPLEKMGLVWDVKVAPPE